MKKSAIKEIFNGTRGHYETMHMPKHENYMQVAHETYNMLKEKLSPELLALHQKLVDSLEDNWIEEMDFYFVEGFKLGLAIGIETIE